MIYRWVLAVCTCAIFALSGAASNGRGQEASVKDEHGVFTGEVKLVFYVSDVRKSAALYRDVLGFTFHHYHDYESGKSVVAWTREEKPIYAEMSYAGRRFGIHRPTSAADERCVGGAKVYLRVKDLGAHHRRVKARGAEPSKMVERPWMNMFRVTDPDGNRIYFAYTEDAVHGNPWFGK